MGFSQSQFNRIENSLLLLSFLEKIVIYVNSINHLFAVIKVAVKFLDFISFLAESHDKASKPAVPTIKLVEVLKLGRFHY